MSLNVINTAPDSSSSTSEAAPVVADARLAFLTRRTSAIRLAAPAPSTDELRSIVLAATAVPDHARLRPYRFVVVSGDARETFGTALALAAVEKNPGAQPFADKVKMKAYFGPLLVAVIASPRPGASVPVWEQEATAACAGFGLVLAAEALGYGAVWKSAPVHEGKAITSTLQLRDDGSEKLLGWVNIGTRADTPLNRPKVDVDSLITTL